MSPGCVAEVHSRIDSPSTCAYAGARYGSSSGVCPGVAVVAMTNGALSCGFP